MNRSVASVMDPRLADLLTCWRHVFGRNAAQDPLSHFADHTDHLLVIDFDGSRARYSHYGSAFSRQFGNDLTGQTVHVLPPDIMPAERRGMLEFEYAFARRIRRPLWRSYTADFGAAIPETWQRLVLPTGDDRLVVGAYPCTGGHGDDTAAALLRLMIDRVPVVLGDDGGVADLALSLRDFSDTQQHAAELEVLAALDPLTGVANLRHFHQLAAMEMEHARRMGRAFSVLALDIDHFKRINDSWGHAVGDDALRAFVAACRIALREPDILGRCGGEEFAVALPNTGSDGAVIIAERLRHQVEKSEQILPGGHILRFTVSVGTATFTPSGQDGMPSVHNLLARADKALYRSKADGRNRVSVADDDGFL